MTGRRLVTETNETPRGAEVNDPNSTIFSILM